MITIDDKEYRNLQEQVGYLTEELKKIKQSLGSALPEPIEGPQGPTGATGATGPQGRSPKIGFGFGPLPDDDSFQDGDIYIARGTVNGLTKGNMYKKVNGSWQLQLNIVGPQGPVGPLNTNEVVANPDETPSDTLYKVDIDGVIYEVLDNNKRDTLSHISDHTLFLDFDKLAQFSRGLSVKQSLEFAPNANMKMLQSSNYFKFLSLSQLKDNSSNPIVICENFNDSNGNARFVEGDIDVSPVTGVTINYKKWSLSGSHLMIVVGGTLTNGSTFSLYAVCQNFPEWIANKIVPLANENVRLSSTKAYGTDLSSQDIPMYLQKTGTIISIYCPSEVMTADRNFCIQFDLLIDMA